MYIMSTAAFFENPFPYTVSGFPPATHWLIGPNHYFCSGNGNRHSVVGIICLVPFLIRWNPEDESNSKSRTEKVLWEELKTNPEISSEIINKKTPGWCGEEVPGAFGLFDIYYWPAQFSNFLWLYLHLSSLISQNQWNHLTIRPDLIYP